jgi:hypothetical protein
MGDSGTLTLKSNIHHYFGHRSENSIYALNPAKALSAVRFRPAPPPFGSRKVPSEAHRAKEGILLVKWLRLARQPKSASKKPIVGRAGPLGPPRIARHSRILTARPAVAPYLFRRPLRSARQSLIGPIGFRPPPAYTAGNGCWVCACETGR